MILPFGYQATMTDEEVVEAFIRDGETPAQARAAMRMLRHPDPRYPVD